MDRIVDHDWTVFAHPLFLAQIEALTQQVNALKQKDPVGYVKKNAAKRLAAITKLAFDVIPQDPTQSESPCVRLVVASFFKADDPPALWDEQRERLTSPASAK